MPAPTCSAVSVGYGAWTRTGPNNTPWNLNFTASEDANFEVWTGANRTGTMVASGPAVAGSNSKSIARDAPGIVNGSQTLYLSLNT